jgi:hypothetical protein
MMMMMMMMMIRQWDASLSEAAARDMIEDAAFNKATPRSLLLEALDLMDFESSFGDRDIEPSRLQGAWRVVSDQRHHHHHHRHHHHHDHHGDMWI